MVEVLNTVHPQKVGGKIEIAGIMAQGFLRIQLISDPVCTLV